MTKSEKSIKELAKKQRAELKQAKIVAALKGLKKMFQRYKWFDFVGTGRDDDGFVLIVGSKTKPPARRANQCVEYMGFRVAICGPWPKTNKVPSI